MEKKEIIVTESMLLAAIREMPDNPVPLSIYAAVLCEEERFSEAISVLETYVDRFGQATGASLRREVAKTYLWKAKLLSNLDRPEDARATLLSAVEYLEHLAPDDVRSELLAQGLADLAGVCLRLERNEEVLEGVARLEALFAAAPRPELRLTLAEGLKLKARALRCLERWDDGLAVCAEVVRQFGADTGAFRRPVLEALVVRAECQSNQMRFAPAVQTYLEIIDREIFKPSVETSDLVLLAFERRAGLLKLMGRNKEALTAYEEADIWMLVHSKLLSLREVAPIWFEHAQLLEEQARLEEASRKYGELISRCQEAKSPQLQALVARSQYSQARMLLEQHREVEALELFNQLLARHQENAPPELHETLTEARIHKANALLGLERFSEAVALLSELSTALTTDPESPNQADRARGRVVTFLLAMAFRHTGRFPEALELLDRMLEDVRCSLEPSSRNMLVSALWLKCDVLFEAGRIEASLEAANELIRLFRRVGSELQHGVVANVMSRKAQLLRMLGRRQEALETAEAAVGRFESSEPDRHDAFVQSSVNAAILHKAGALLDMRRPDESLYFSEEVLRRAFESQEPDPDLEAHGLLQKGMALQAKGDREQGRMVLEALVEKYGRTQGKSLGRVIGAALLQLSLNEIIRMHELRKSGQPELAEERLEAAWSKIVKAEFEVGDEPTYLFTRGYLAMLRGQPEEARALVRRARDRNPTMTRELATLLAESALDYAGKEVLTWLEEDE